MHKSLIKFLAQESGFELKKKLNDEMDLDDCVYLFADKLLLQRQGEIDEQQKIINTLKERIQGYEKTKCNLLRRVNFVEERCVCFRDNSELRSPR